MDWGLGHATRCIPVIREFLSRGCEVQIASSGDALVLLKQEFPVLKFHQMISYRAKYSLWLPLMFKMILQLPKFLSAIKKEHDELEQIIDKEKIDFVVSDNRYGCWSSKIPSVLITHQVNILMSPAWKWLEWIINYGNHRQIKKFSECWVPDFLNGITGGLTSLRGRPDQSLPARTVRQAGNPHLNGDCFANACPAEAAPSRRVRAKGIPLDNDGRITIKFIGMLSRFKKMNLPMKYDVLALVSGPEPQRTIFESEIKKQLASSSLNYFIVKGKPNSFEKSKNETDHLNSRELNAMIESSTIIIARSGYTTIMDICKLGKKAIFIPTPGQTEQEFLAIELKRKGIVFSESQKKFNLSIALSESKKYKGFDGFPSSPNLLADAINTLLISKPNL